MRGDARGTYTVGSDVGLYTEAEFDAARPTLERMIRGGVVVLEPAG